MSPFRWRNIPVPEGYVMALVLGLVLQARQPLRFIGPRRLKHLAGWPLVLLGVLLAAWAVVSARDVEIDRPARLVVSGPYAFSRNPMYVAWTAIYAGIAVLVNAGWLVLFLPPLIAFTHYGVVRREERQLERRFGEAYRRYREGVRRYL